MSNSATIVFIAGAIMVDTMLRLKPVADMASVTAHFCLIVLASCCLVQYGVWLTDLR